MRVLFLCGVFAKENEAEIIANAKRPVEYSANIFQEKIINGFKSHEIDFEVLSAPFIGSYPNAYKKSRFTGFIEKQDKYKYVRFNNIWGLRNFSRSRALKKALGTFISSDEKQKLIVIYSPHTPFLSAAAYAKKKDPSIKICLIIPDLPQYMNLNKKQSILYKIGKKYDIKEFNKLNGFVDSYVLLTEAMTDKIDTHGKPYIVVEGIVTETERNNQSKPDKDELDYIVYTGKMNERFGVINLIKAFRLLPEERLRLILCGVGDAVEYVREQQKEDSRIISLGQVTPEVAKEWIKKATVLVNPRQNDEEYTKYSFPSKNIEYLLSGNAVVAYKLDGMNDCYREFMYCPNDNSIKALAETIKMAIEKGSKQGFWEYSKELTAEKITKKILEILID